MRISFPTTPKPSVSTMVLGSNQSGLPAKSQQIKAKSYKFSLGHFFSTILAVVMLSAVCSCGPKEPTLDGLALKELTLEDASQIFSKLSAYLPKEASIMPHDATANSQILGESSQAVVWLLSGDETGPSMSCLMWVATPALAGAVSPNDVLAEEGYVGEGISVNAGDRAIASYIVRETDFMDMDWQLATLVVKYSNVFIVLTCSCLNGVYEGVSFQQSFSLQSLIMPIVEILGPYVGPVDYPKDPNQTLWTTAPAATTIPAPIAIIP